MNRNGCIRSGGFLVISILILLLAFLYENAAFTTAKSNFKDFTLLKPIGKGEQKAIIVDIDRYMKVEPSSEVPLVKQGLLFFHNGKIDEAKKVLKKAQDINPRNREAALSLMVIYLSEAEAQIDKGLAQLDLLFRLNPSQMQKYVALLSSLTKNMPDSRETLERVKLKPKWAKHYVAFEIENNPNTDGMVDLLLAWAQAYPTPAESFSEQERFLKRLLAEKRYDVMVAYRDRYLELFGHKDSLIFDMSFENLQAPRSIGWRLIADRQDYTEFLPSKGLLVGYRGQTRSSIMSQLFWPQDNTKALNFSMQYSSSLGWEGVTFLWELGCRSPQFQIDSWSLQPSEKDITINQLVKLPESKCSAYVVKLIAKPGNKIKENNLIIKNVSITPIFAEVNQDVQGE